MGRVTKKFVFYTGGMLGFVLLANFAYLVKTELGIKLTNQPHHGWLFPIADQVMLHIGYPLFQAHSSPVRASGKIHFPPPKKSSSFVWPKSGRAGLCSPSSKQRSG